MNTKTSLIGFLLLALALVAIVVAIKTYGSSKQDRANASVNQSVSPESGPSADDGGENADEAPVVSEERLKRGGRTDDVPVLLKPADDITATKLQPWIDAFLEGRRNPSFIKAYEVIEVDTDLLRQIRHEETDTFRFKFKQHVDITFDVKGIVEHSSSWVMWGTSRKYRDSLVELSFGADGDILGGISIPRTGKYTLRQSPEPQHYLVYFSRGRLDPH